MNKHAASSTVCGILMGVGLRFSTRMPQSFMYKSVTSRKVGEYVRIVDIVERHVEVFKPFDDIGTFREFPINGRHNVCDIAISQDLWST
jgi:hypothetical protein